MWSLQKWVCPSHHVPLTRNTPTFFLYKVGNYERERESYIGSRHSGVLLDLLKSDVNTKGTRWPVRPVYPHCKHALFVTRPAGILVSTVTTDWARST